MPFDAPSDENGLPFCLDWKQFGEHPYALKTTFPAVAVKLCGGGWSSTITAVISTAPSPGRWACDLGEPELSSVATCHDRHNRQRKLTDQRRWPHCERANKARTIIQASGQIAGQTA